MKYLLFPDKSTNLVTSYSAKEIFIGNYQNISSSLQYILNMELPNAHFGFEICFLIGMNIACLWHAVLTLHDFQKG